jgi:hypothetical protein
LAIVAIACAAPLRPEQVSERSLQAVFQIQSELNSIQVEDMDTEVDPATQALIARFKDALAVATNDFMGSLQRDSFQTSTAQAKFAALDMCLTQVAAIGCGLAGCSLRGAFATISS